MRNSTILLIVFLATILNSNAQSETCDCKKDLDFVVEKIRKMPSYKKQIKNDKLIEFNSTYNESVLKMKQPIPLVDCFQLLQKQLMIVNDIHANIYFEKKYLTKETIEDEAKLLEFKNSDVFKNHPKTTFNLAELEAKLKQKSDSSLEGIYNYRDIQKIGIYLSENKKDLIGVVLESNVDNWDVGEIRFYATHTTGNKYNVFDYNITSRSPSMIKSVSFENGRLWGYKKINNTLNHEFAPKENEDLEFKQLTKNVQYLYFKSFNRRNKKAYKSFYEKVKNRLTSKNVIIDLRNNGGGNEKLSDPFLKLLKRKNVFIITNSFTVSNAEQFTVKLKKIKNAMHLGQVTKGAISYGMNYGYDYLTPSSFFRILPTDMDFHKFVEYEGKGVSPDIALSFDKDWIEQTLEIIKRRSL